MTLPLSSDRSPSSLRLTQTEIAVARTVATLAHWGQVTKSDQQPFIVHPASVAYALPLEDQAAGWLHDVLEDTKVTAEMLLAVGISPDTVRAVVIVSRRDPMTESYPQFIERIRVSNNLKAIRVKIADLQHNLRPGCPETLARRYGLALPILLDAEHTLVRSQGW